MNNVNFKTFASFISMKFYSGNILDLDLLSGDARCLMRACVHAILDRSRFSYQMLDNLK